MTMLRMLVACLAAAFALAAGSAQAERRPSGSNTATAIPSSKPTWPMTTKGLARALPC
jgi:hypothetical protein